MPTFAGSSATAPAKAGNSREASEHHGGIAVVVALEACGEAGGFEHRDHDRRLLLADLGQYAAAGREPLRRRNGDASHDVETVDSAIESEARFVEAGFTGKKIDLIRWHVRRDEGQQVDAPLQRGRERREQVTLVHRARNVAASAGNRGRVDVDSVQLCSANGGADCTGSAAQVEQHGRRERPPPLDEQLAATPRNEHPRFNRESDAAQLRPPQHHFKRLARTARRNHAVELVRVAGRLAQQSGLVFGEHAARSPQSDDDGIQFEHVSRKTTRAGSENRNMAFAPLRNVGIRSALAAALLFGAGTPIAKLLLDDVSPWLLAGLLYTGSGLGLGLFRLIRRAPRVRLQRRELLPLGGAVLFGGVIAPLLLLFGLASMPASGASLLLNAEAVFTAVLAWFVFRENVDRRVALGLLAIVAGAVLLSIPTGADLGEIVPSLAVLGACLCWGLDNNFTRMVALNDAAWLAAVKGGVAGPVNLLIALAIGSALPSVPSIAVALVVGFFAYGVSLVLFIIGLRHLGTARAGAYFSVAPFFGTVLALAFGEPITVLLVIAALLMALGVWLHLTERHEHEHTHPATATEPAVTHTHPHFPDSQHRHPHAGAR